MRTITLTMSKLSCSSSPHTSLKTEAIQGVVRLSANASPDADRINPVQAATAIQAATAPTPRSLLARSAEAGALAVSR